MPRGINVYDEARLQGRLWTPTLLRGVGKLARWFTAADVDCDGSAGISPFRDLSGWGANATQATAGTRPVFTRGVYRRPYALYDTSEKFNIFTTVTYNGTNGVSWAGVVFYNSSNQNTIIGGSSGGELQFRINTSNQVQLVRRAQADLVNTTATLTVNTPAIVGCDAASSGCAAWLNGTSVSNGSNAAVSNGGSNIGTGGAGEHLRGGVFEVLGSELKWVQRERDLVDGYLAWQNGLVGSLPASHPFASRPPLIGD